MEWKDLERYLKGFRPMLMTRPTEYVFLPSPKGESQSPRPRKELAERVFGNTKRYLWRFPGMGLRALRRSVATALLKASGNNVNAAAMLLNDWMSAVGKY